MFSKLKEIFKRSRYIVMIYEDFVGKWYKTVNDIQKNLNKIDAFQRWKMLRRSKGQKRYFLVTSMLIGRPVGLYSAIMVVLLPYMEYALKRGWIPVFDFGRDVYLPLFQDEEQFGLENPWEYYYEQPQPTVSLEEIYQSNCVLEAWYWRKKISLFDIKKIFPVDEKTLQHYHEIIYKYIRLNKGLEERVAIEKEKIFKFGQKILGVAIRAGFRAGAMRGLELLNGHSRVASCEEMMSIAEDKMREWRCDCIFLAVDDREYSNKFIAKFGDKCCFLDRKRLHYLENDVIPQNIKDSLVEFEGVSVRERNEEYIVETYLLAQCDSLYGCHSGGATFAYFLNGGKYEHVEVYSAGVYEGLEK